MEIIPLLKNYAQNLTVDNEKAVKSVFFGNDYETNIKSPGTLYPMCQLVPILSSSVNISKFGIMTNQWEIFVFFCDVQPKGIDSTADDNDPIIVAMRKAGVMFAGNLSVSPEFEPVNRINFQTLFFKFDSLVSGVLVNFTLKEKNGFRIC